MQFSSIQRTTIRGTRQGPPTRLSAATSIVDIDRNAIASSSATDESSSSSQSRNFETLTDFRLNFSERAFSAAGAAVLSAVLVNPLDVAKDPNLLAGLNTHWPDIERGGNVGKWIYQWRKHGTCSLIFYGQMEYFNLAVMLKTQYDLKGHLAGNNIVPSNAIKYKVSDITDAIKSLTGQPPGVDCTVYAQNEEQLFEIRLCFDRGGVIIDCTLFRPSQTTCNNTDVYFPLTPAP